MNNKGRFLKKYRGNECLNCGVPLDLIDKYCHNCGQINTTKKLSFKDFFNEFFASIFSYDSRLRHTIIALLFKPGKISKEFIEGRRVKYANPFRFYLSVSIIFFIITGFLIDFDRMSQEFIKDNEVTQKGLNFKVKPKKQTTTDQDSSKVVSTKIKNKKDVVYYSEQQLDTMTFSNAFDKRMDTYVSYYKRTNEVIPEIALDSLNHKKSWYNTYVYKRSIKTHKISDNPIELFRFVFNNLTFIIFFFLPIFALSIWFLYLRRSFNYMEHLVFTFHTQTMFFILLGIAFLLNEIVHSGIPLGIALLIFLFYLYKAMRKFYNQKRLKTIVKFLLVNILFFILAGIGSGITIVGALFIF